MYICMYVCLYYVVCMFVLCKYIVKFTVSEFLWHGKNDYDKLLFKRY